MITLVVNGQERQVEGPTTVAGYLLALGVDARYVAVARNGEVLERGAFPDTPLADGDRLEIVRPVGGGAERPLSP